MENLNTILKDITIDVPNTLIASSTLLAAYGAWKAYEYLSYIWSSSVRNLPGPPSSSIVFGNANDVSKADPGVVQQRWLEKYGPVMKYYAFFGVRLLLCFYSLLSFL